MFHMVDFNFKWIPQDIPESLMEKMNVLMRDDVDNVLLYRRIVLDLAAQCINPGRMVMIHLFSEAAKEHLVKRL